MQKSSRKKERQKQKTRKTQSTEAAEDPYFIFRMYHGI